MTTEQEKQALITLRNDLARVMLSAGTTLDGADLNDLGHAAAIVRKLIEAHEARRLTADDRKARAA